MRKINNDEVRYFAPQQIAFETKSHNLKGRIYSDGFRATCDTGALPSRYHESVIDASYVVFSYETPIAWFKSCEWFIPPVHYSVTTSKHQSVLRIYCDGFCHNWAEDAPQVSITEDIAWNDSHKTFRLLVEFDAVDPRVGFHLHNVWTLTRTKYDWKLDNGEGQRESIGINADWTDEQCENVRQAVRATIFTQF